MNKWTLVAVLGVVAIGLAAAAFFLMSQPEAPEVKALKLPALTSEDEAPKPQPEDDILSPKKKKPTMEPVGPADRIVVETARGILELRRESKDLWKIVKPYESVADITKVKAMLRPFDEEAESSFSVTVDPSKLQKYGLDEANRITIAIYKGEQTLYNLVIGNADSPDNEGEAPDTLVMATGGDTVYRIKGKDLRRPFAIPFEDLRDKKLFTFAKNDITRIEATDPRSELAGSIIAEKAPEAAPAEGETPPPAKAEWNVLAPTTVPLEGLDGFATSIANMRAIEFLEKLPEADAKALDKPYVIKVTTKQGTEEKVVTINIGAGRKSGVYAKVDTFNGILVIDANTANSVMKSVNDLRKKKLFSFKEPDVVGFSIQEKGKTAIVAKRGEKGWIFDSPAGETPYDTKIKSYLEVLSNLNAAEFLTKEPDAATSGLAEGGERTVTVTLKSGETHTLTVGKLFKDGSKGEKYYIRLSGVTESMTVMKYVIDNATKSLDDLRDRRVFRFEKDQIDEVTIKHPDETVVIKAPTEANAKWKMTSPKENNEIDMNATLGALTSLEVTEEVAGKKPEDVGLTGKDAITVTLKLKDGTLHSVTISEDVKKDDHYAQSAEPHCSGKILLVSKHKVKEIIKKVADFEKKATPEAPPQMPGGMPGLMM